MAQNESLYAELDARLDASEAQAEWCDHCMRVTQLRLTNF